MKRNILSGAQRVKYGKMIGSEINKFLLDQGFEQFKKEGGSDSKDSRDFYRESDDCYAWSCLGPCGSIRIAKGGQVDRVRLPILYHGKEYPVGNVTARIKSEVLDMLDRFDVQGT